MCYVGQAFVRGASSGWHVLFWKPRQSLSTNSGEVSGLSPSFYRMSSSSRVPASWSAISLRGDDENAWINQSKRTQKQRPLRAPAGHAADHAATRRFHRAAFPMSNRASVFVQLAAGRVQARHGRLKRLLAPSAKFRGIHFVPGSEGRPSGDFMGTGFPFPYVTTTHG